MSPLLRARLRREGAFLPRPRDARRAFLAWSVWMPCSCLYFAQGRAASRGPPGREGGTGAVGGVADAVGTLAPRRRVHGIEARGGAPVAGSEASRGAELAHELCERVELLARVVAGALLAGHGGLRRRCVEGLGIVVEGAPHRVTLGVYGALTASSSAPLP
jgi:hypothetical protein